MLARLPLLPAGALQVFLLWRVLTAAPQTDLFFLLLLAEVEGVCASVLELEGLEQPCCREDGLCVFERLLRALLEVSVVPALVLVLA